MRRTAALLTGITLLAPAPAWAYVGPGITMAVLGPILALLGAIFLAIVGFVWYPIRRMRRRRREALARRADAESARDTDDEDEGRA